MTTVRVRAGGVLVAVVFFGRTLIHVHSTILPCEERGADTLVIPWEVLTLGTVLAVWFLGNEHLL